MEEFGYILIPSPWCSVGVVWTKKGKNAKAARIFLSKTNDGVRKDIAMLFPGAKKTQNRKIGFVSEKIRCYLKGEITYFNSSALQKNLCSRFQWTAYRKTKQIPYGRVVTYKALTKLIGTKSARAVGNALAKNPFPIAIPCHRVVDSRRRIGGFQSTKFLKKALLKSEGIKFDKKGRIPEAFFI